LPQAVLQRRHSVQPKATLRVKRLTSTRAPIGRFSAPGLENDAPRPLNRLIVPRHLPRAAPGPDIARSGAAPPRGAWAPAGRCATLAAIRGAAPDVGLTEVRAMATMAELRERVQRIYDTAPLRPMPEFPPPPDRFLAPERFADAIADAVLDHSAKVIHPFILRLMRGEYTWRQLQAWAKEGFHDKVQTIRNDAMIVATAATLDEMKKQARVVASEAGVDGAGDSHPELWLRFGEGLGLTRDEITNSEPTPLTQVILEAERYRSLSQRIGGLPANMRM